MLVLGRRGQDPSIQQIRLSKAISHRIRRRIESSQAQRARAPYAKRLGEVELFSEAWGPWLGNISDTVGGFDIIQLHWVSGLLNYRAFFREVPTSIPLVWRLADMNPFTGGCHYDGGCGRFAASCGCCPTLDSQRESDLSRAIWGQKQAALAPLSSTRLHIVALNGWMASHVARSSLLSRFERSIIPNGVDLEEFKPVPREAARGALGLPIDRHILAFVSESASNPRKGLCVLCEALRRLRHRRDLLLLIVGGASDLPELGLPAVMVGQVQNPVFLRQVYCAADAFVMPSLEDNQPNTVLEAMACATPVVGFEVGGVPEMVEHLRTGMLAPRGDAVEFARAIEHLLDHNDQREQMGERARARAETLFSRDLQVTTYLDLYSNLLANRTKSNPGLLARPHPVAFKRAPTCAAQS